MMIPSSHNRLLVARGRKFEIEGVSCFLFCIYVFIFARVSNRFRVTVVMLKTANQVREVVRDTQTTQSVEPG